MSTKVKSIIGAVRTRLDGTGYRQVSGRQVDPKSDDLPALALFFDPKSSGGIQSDEDASTTMRANDKSRETLNLVVEAVCEIIDIASALEELEDLHTAVHAKLFGAEDTNLGGLARRDVVMTERHSFVPDGHDKYGKIQIHVQIPFVESI